VLQILEDDLGSLWLGTLQGIVRVRLDDLNGVADGRLQVLPQTVFGKSDGLKTTETSGGTQPAAWKSSKGNLLFATNRGIAMIDPSNIRTNPIAPPLHVEGVFIDGKPIPAGDDFTLSAGKKDITIRYTGLSFRAPDQVQFAYKLEGYDADWIDAGARRDAYYTNLPPGEYRFLVRAANSDDVWNERGASVAFYLEPFFYQTWWFKLIAGVAIMFAAFLAYWLRIRQLKARERELERVVDDRTMDLRLEKERTEEAKRVIEGQAEKLRELDRFKTRFFANVSHEFRTPLTMIIGPLENMLAAAKEHLTDGGRTQLEMMLRNALRLMRLINQLLDLSKLEDGKMQLRAQPRDIVAFVEGIVSSCSVLAEGKRISLTFDSDAEEILLCYEPDKLEKVFFNLLSNAAKFTPQGGSIRVFISQESPLEKMPEGAVQISVCDTGKGIPA
ncbi:MAG: triple tyrosine motif-containing protein, partial [Rhodothermales bacterium]